VDTGSRHPDPARLRSYEIFSTLTPEQAERLSRMTEEIEVDPGKVLAPEGASGYFFYVIEEGEADVLHGDETVRRLGPGDHFGEISILTGGRRTATVRAVTRMRLVSVFGTAFREMETDFPELAEIIDAQAQRWLESDETA
jgi:CRP/FNR family transcriptional regulator, cyclic AMP receptor protein